MATLVEQLEAIKHLPMYAVSLYYGCDIGCDDIDIKAENREIKIVGTPIGVLGEARQMWKAKTLAAFLNMDISAKPKVVSNPPEYKEIEKPGIYLWGTVSAIERLTKK